VRAGHLGVGERHAAVGRRCRPGLDVQSLLEQASSLLQFCARATTTARTIIITIIIIIIIINDNVYGAVIVTMVTARVHSVHFMNAD